MKVRLKFWCAKCGFKTFQTQRPEIQSTQGIGLVWECEVCKRRVERSAFDAERGQQE